jgi:VIT1/CCC1 family predicted Fe2+/Mn2+ transporter
MSPTSRPPKEWLHHWHDETDAAYLYRLLAEREPAPKRRDIFRRLAVVEDRHTAIWEKLLADNGVAVGARRPSLRARLLATLARVFGVELLAQLLLREEGREVRAYLALHRESAPGEAKDAALKLARESVQHAEALGSLVESDGEPWHRTASGGFLRNVVYGFNDGLTANFGLVAGVIGASVEPHVLLVSGIAGMIADALSMGASGYLAAKSEQEVYAHEIAMEAEEIRLMPEVEAEELALMYEGRGIPPAQARQMAHRVIADPEQALAEQVREELGIGEERVSPLREGWVTGLATAVGALIPVAPFLFTTGPAAMWASFFLAMASHFAVGAARSVFTGRGFLRSGLDMFLVGLGVAGVGYLAGDFLVARLLR